jgi:phosphate-selective porin OprO/OprP
MDKNAAENEKAEATKPMAEGERNAPAIKAAAEGVYISSGDTDFSLAIHGVLQADNRSFFGDGGIKGNDGFLLRRARPILSGTLFRDFDFLVVPDFGGNSVTIQDAYLNYKYAPWLQLQAGKSKVPVGLELLQSDPNTLFNERALPTALVPNRDIGFQLRGEIAAGIASYSAGVFNGVGDGRSTVGVDFDDNREVAARLFFQPFKKSDWDALQGFGFGIGASYTSTSDTNSLPSTTGGRSPGYFTDGQQQFFAYNPAAIGGTNPVVVPGGDHWRLAPQAYYYWGPFGLMGEYVVSDQRLKRMVVGSATTEIQNTAWQITGSWLLTGETASYGAVMPIRPFRPQEGRWGALQVIARYACLNVDNAAFPLFANPATSASAAHAWSAGLNWYLNRNIKLGASYSHTEFSGGGGGGTSAPATITRQPENVFFTRLQLAF